MYKGQAFADQYAGTQPQPGGGDAEGHRDGSVAAEERDHEERGEGSDETEDENLRRQLVRARALLRKFGGGENGTGGFGEGTALPAPQAGALKGMVEGVVQGNAPLDKYVAGAVIGGSLALFPIAGLGVLIGLAMYLPFEITLGYGIGCVTSMMLEKKLGRRFYGDFIVPVAAGFIVGEALTSLTITMIKLAGGS